jgi:hypothetical protein
LPSASAPFVSKPFDRSRVWLNPKPALQFTCSPDAAASTASRPHVRDDGQRPSSGRDSESCKSDLGPRRSRIFFQRGARQAYRQTARRANQSVGTFEKHSADYGNAPALRVHKVLPNSLTTSPSPRSSKAPVLNSCRTIARRRIISPGSCKAKSPNGRCRSRPAASASIDPAIRAGRNRSIASQPARPIFRMPKIPPAESEFLRGF